MDEGKKRKMCADGSSKTNKKVLVEKERDITVSLQDTNEWLPVVASIPGIAFPPSIPFQPYTKLRKEPSQRPHRSGVSAITELLLHSSAHPKIDYTAREDEAGGGAGGNKKHYVGVYDPQTGKLEILEARKLVARGVVKAHQAIEEDRNLVSSNQELRTILGRTFGTKKAQKAIAALTENAIGPARSGRAVVDGDKPMKLDAVGTAVVASMAEATRGMPSRDELQEQADAAKPRPKANLSATDIKDVYTADSLIGLEMMKQIPVFDWTQTLKAKKEVVINSRYVARRIKSVGLSIEKLKLLRYMLLLIEFYNSARPGRGGVKALPRRDDMRIAMGAVPEGLVESVKRKFSEGGTLPKFKVDLLITHICALACLVDNYEVDMFDLQYDLKLDIKPLSKYFREIGAKIVSLPEAQRKALELDKAAAAQRKVARLKLPLDFPKVAFARSKR